MFQSSDEIWLLSPCEHFFLPANLSQDGKQLEGTSGGLVLAHSKANLEVGQDCLEPLSYLKISEEGEGGRSTISLGSCSWVVLFWRRNSRLKSKLENLVWNFLSCNCYILLFYFSSFWKDFCLAQSSWWSPPLYLSSADFDEIPTPYTFSSSIRQTHFMCLSFTWVLKRTIYIM